MSAEELLYRGIAGAYAIILGIRFFVSWAELSILETSPASLKAKTRQQQKLKTERLAGRLTAVRFFAGKYMHFRGKNLSREK